MCGISAIASSQNVAQRLFQSIRSLEYRGYDSCGVALQYNGRIEVRKDTGTVEAVNERERLTEMRGPVGIAHTRWATHGRVSRANTHPHLSCEGDFALVHNGIISNYKGLREELSRGGHLFRSETDTEVVAHLVEHHFVALGDAESAFVRAIRELEGTYALALITTHDPDKVFCAKRASPLVIGLGDDANYVGSDFNAFVEFTKNAVVMDDGEYAVITKDSFSVKSISTGLPVRKEVMKIHWDAEMSKRGGYPHYMLKEIYDQPQAIRNVLNLEVGELAALAQMIYESRMTYLVGAGTTYYISRVGQYYMSQLAGSYIPAVSSDEFRNLAQLDSRSLALAVSQSGETYDTLSSLRYAQEQGARTAAIVNVMGSSMARMVDHVILQGSGPEICVVSTKAAFAQMAILYLLALELALKQRRMRTGERDRLRDLLGELPQIVEATLNERSGFVHTIANRYQGVRSWLYLGRDIYYPTALEASLKMKEVTYLHAEGMSAGFLKHGTIAMIDKDINTVLLVPPPVDSEVYSLTISSAEEIKARDGLIIALRFEDDSPREGLFDEEVILPSVPPPIAPFLHLLAAQLLAYFTAVALRRDPDKPRSLAKSVTVE